MTRTNPKTKARSRHDRHARFDDDLDQMSFADLAHLPQVTRVHDMGISVIESTAQPDTPSPKRNRKVLIARWLLLAFIRNHGVGHEFQAVDFSCWATQQPQYDDSIDLRCTGGMFRQMVDAGILSKHGYRNNGGDASRNYHGTPRVVYRIELINFALLGWPEDLSGIEQRGVWTDDDPPQRRTAS